MADGEEPKPLARPGVALEKKPRMLCCPLDDDASLEVVGALAGVRAGSPDLSAISLTILERTKESSRHDEELTIGGAGVI